MEKIQEYQPYTSVGLSGSRHREVLDAILSPGYKLGPRKVDKPIAIYGAGTMGQMAQAFFEHIGLPVSLVIDKGADGRNHDSFWQSRTKVFSPSEVSKADKESHLLLICIATLPLIEIRDWLSSEGWTDIAFFYDVSQSYIDKHPLNNGWFIGNLSSSDTREIRLVFNSWDDEMSRAHYLQFLAWRKCRVEILSQEFPVLGDNRYFIPEVVDRFWRQEFFVDCGAHTGSVIPTFLEKVGGSFKHIYAIEPDTHNLKKLEEGFGHMKGLSISYVALSNTEGMQLFSSGFDYASRLNSSGNSLVETKLLDNFSLSPTFVKMHLEGGELRALQGGMETIVYHRPILAITVYHNDDGILKIPTLLMAALDRYRFLFRVHSWAGTGAVIYAIPKER